MASDPLVRALSHIARIVGETLELRDVFARVAEAAGAVVPFDHMGLARLDAPGSVAFYAAFGRNARKDEGRIVPLESFSLAIRPQPRAGRIDDAARTLDPAFPMDREILAHGVRSILHAPLLRGPELAGTLWFGSPTPGVFTAAHEAAVQPVADILALALEHERLWNQDALRRLRLEALERLLLTMAEALDVREIFNQVSAVVQSVLPHDRMVLASLDAEQRVVHLDAVSGASELGLPPSFELDDVDWEKRDLEYELVADLSQPAHEGRLRAERKKILVQQGLRSFLRIPLRLAGGGLGSLVFLSRDPGRYGREDVEVARRVADHVALALSHQRLSEEVLRAAEARDRAARLERRVEALRAELETTLAHRRVVGESKSWSTVLQQAARVAPTETTVLLTGESGTGKEVVARFIHRGSARADGAFVALNCAALPEDLLESELFGHEKGAFTGATAARAGRIEQAAGGVLFLDEVGEMSPGLQVKLLRVLQEREFQRLGAARPQKADIRIIAATNRDLEAAMARGEFREDLYYRLRVFEIRLPPLRERHEDVLPLAEAFLEEIGPAVGRPAAGLSRDAREALLAHGWPGNVRELRNALERATILCDGGLITTEHLPFSPAPAQGIALAASFPPGGVVLDSVERDLMTKALEAAGQNRSRAARLLGITRSQLYYRMQKHGIEQPIVGR